MYTKATTTYDLNCDACRKNIPADTDYYDDSVYNSLYAKIDIQKTLCWDCGTKYWAEKERRYQEYERREGPKRFKRLIGILLLLGAFIVLLSHVHFD